MCEASCFAGLLAEQRGDLAGARTRYRACVDTGVKTFQEWVWAQARLASPDLR